MDPMTSAPDPAAPGAPDSPAPPAVAAPPAAEAAPAGTESPAPGPAVPDDPAGLLGAGALRPVSPRLIRSRYVASIPVHVLWVLLTAGAVTGSVLADRWWIAALGLLPLLILAQSLAFTPRRVRAIGYLDAAEDLTIASGIMFRAVHTIPYGRVQSVKIDEGPVDRRYGLAQLTVTTASDASTAVLPGLPKEEAERLRALLTARGIENMAAL